VTIERIPLFNPQYRDSEEFSEAKKAASKDRRNMKYASDGDVSRRALIVACNISAEEIGGLFKKANGSLLECGHRLLAKRTSMQHGEWLPWLEANSEILGFGERTAQLLIKAAKTFPQLTSDLPDAELNRLIWGNTSKPAPRISLEQAAASFLPKDESIVATVLATTAGTEADVEDEAIDYAAKMVGVSTDLVRKAHRIGQEHPERMKELEDGKATVDEVYSELFTSDNEHKDAPAPGIKVDEAIDLLLTESSQRQIVDTYKRWRGKVNQLRNALAKAEVELAEAEKALLKAAIKKRGES
jgi:hypothetical protein